ncbi:carbohydrate ABC transporter permease [Lachnoclostridium phytofermentans]|uniref:Binding-protein-dependent transport systems inner membrane component n=1 Tax=Lachnoclostridium phytofermentans (strain ATCC 700394 / DSM 18823 / ISDg) TaxID=357809 RepID=A9KRK8_LACP7|nr:carbohydrate ABC transporter permease [Lachnoclostridium phytofermentans]ABX42082.1 binding-protein-dependent transport systems inner membrane component [Lachnoclostridium phytofermentans ISDg]
MKKKNKKSKLVSICIHITFLITCLLIIIPFVLTIGISISSEKDIYTYGYRIIPKNIDLSAYKLLFSAPEVIVNSYLVTILVVVIGAPLGLVMTAMIGYVISRKDYRYKKILTFFVVFTMLFSGGMVSYYMTMTKVLHVQNSLWALILPGLVSAYYIILMRGFMSDIPMEIIESSKIDGASEIKTFTKIILPLSKPALATIGLFMAFNYWNEWYNALLFMDGNKLVPLQLLLVRMLNSVDAMTSNPQVLQQMMMSGMDISTIPTLTLRMATAIVAVGPMLLVFPFFQKYFTKGITLGSVKG